MKIAIKNPLLSVTLLLMAFVAVTATASAQVSGQAFNGFQKNSKDPIQIEADGLEFLDAKNMAIYKGRVKVRQGSSVITAHRMTVNFNQGKGDERGDIRDLIFDGNVVATSGENTVTGDKALYTVQTEIVVVTGKVIISQGENAAMGCKLTANLRTNVAKVDSCNRRVQTILTPGSNNN